MHTDSDTPPEYRCASCGDHALYPVRCDRCDRMMTAPGLADAHEDVTAAERGWLLAGPLIGVGATWSCGAAVFTNGFGRLPWAWGLRNTFETVQEIFLGSWVLTGPLPVVLVTLLGIWLGRAATLTRVREARRARRLARDFEAMCAASPVSLEELRPGHVRVVATIVEATSPVLSNHGLPCAACENLIDGGLTPSPRHSLGTRFFLRDEWGRRVRVDAQHVRVVSGYSFDEEAHVPVGARVELAAVARAFTGEGGEHAANYRRADVTFELVGTPSEPVFLRVLDAV